MSKLLKHNHNPERYDSELLRYATTAEKLPIDVESLLDAGCVNGLFLKYQSGNITEGKFKKRTIKRLCGLDR